MKNCQKKERSKGRRQLRVRLDKANKNISLFIGTM